MLFIAEHAARKQLLGEIRHARSSKNLMAGVPVDCVGRRSNIHVIPWYSDNKDIIDCIDSYYDRYYTIRAWYGGYYNSTLAPAAHIRLICGARSRQGRYVQRRMDVNKINRTAWLRDVLSSCRL